MISILRNVVGSAFADGIIERDPTVGLVRPKDHKKKERRALTPFETKSVSRPSRPTGTAYFWPCFTIPACGVARR